MPPKSATAKSSDVDAADQEKEFVEKELTISFLKTRLSRCCGIYYKSSRGSLNMHAANLKGHCTLQASRTW